MGRGDRRSGRTQPVSVALSEPERERFESEAKRRGLGLSTTIRSLAVERADELAAERQRQRALRWQSERVRALLDRMDAEGFQEASQADIDAVFAEGEAQERRPSPAGA